MNRTSPVAIVWCVALVLTLMSSAQAQIKSVALFVGTYTGEKSKGIHALRLDYESGALTPLGLAAETTNPSFLALSRDGRFLYAVNEIGDFGGQNSGSVTAFAVNNDTGKLAFLNAQPSGGSGPCYLSLDPKGQRVFTANYGNGSVGVLPVQDDGTLDAPVSSIQHQGSGPNPKRQTGPHAHSVITDPGGRFVLAADLGIDRILVYKTGKDGPGIQPNAPTGISAEPGSGPRHMAFHPAGRILYVCNEMGNSITAYDYVPDRGVLIARQTIGTLPGDFAGDNTTAEILVHPGGRFLYVSNRGHDSIACFRIGHDGSLSLKGHVPSGGNMPRGFRIDPTARYLVAANYKSDNLVVFRIDGVTGALLPTGNTAQVGAPVCVVFAATD